MTVTIHFNNYAEEVGVRGNNQWYRWKVFVDEKPEVLDTIKSVQYLLHKTFPNPLRLSDDRNTNFALVSAGWGGFTIYITVNFKNGNAEELKYYLDLSKRGPVS
jgi:transcription initiation factor IIF auxiliary subunit